MRRMDEKAVELWNIVGEWIDKNKIVDEEDVAKADSTVDLVVKLCDFIGYYKGD